MVKKKKKVTSAKSARVKYLHARWKNPKVRKALKEAYRRHYKKVHGHFPGTKRKMKTKRKARWISFR
jgi:hypothetical protein